MSILCAIVGSLEEKIIIRNTNNVNIAGANQINIGRIIYNVYIKPKEIKIAVRYHGKKNKNAVISIINPTLIQSLFYS